MNIREVHFEITDKCNAGCPQCVRTNPNGCVPLDYISNKACSLEQFKQFSPPYFLKQLEHIYFCGNFGDPVMAPDLLAIISYCYEQNPKLSIKVHSNCGIRSRSWWCDLAHLTKGKKFRVVAAIDGASPEVYSLYKVRVNYNKVMENMEAYIKNGGLAEWRFILFEHNQHQLDDAKNIANKMGFTAFKSYSSSRFFEKNEFGYSANNQQFNLKPSSKYVQKFTTQKLIPADQLNKTPIVKFKINCNALQTRSIFIDQDGNITPCCHIGIRLYTYNRNVADVNNDPEIYEILSDFGAKRFNALENSFETALKASLDFTLYLRDRWNNQNPFVCRMICGKKDEPKAEEFAPSTK